MPETIFTGTEGRLLVLGRAAQAAYQSTAK